MAADDATLTEALNLLRNNHAVLLERVLCSMSITLFDQRQLLFPKNSMRMM